MCSRKERYTFLTLQRPLYPTIAPTIHVGPSLLTPLLSYTLLYTPYTPPALPSLTPLTITLPSLPLYPTIHLRAAVGCPPLHPMENPQLNPLQHPAVS